MTRVVGTLDIRKHDARNWYFLRRLKLYANDGRTVELLRALVIDFGSVPRALWSIVPPLGTEADIGFAFHDGLYTKNRDGNPLVIVSDAFSRLEADQLMMEVHLFSKVSQELAEGLYAGVRRGASYAWMPPAEREARRMKAAERRKFDDSILDG